VSQLAQRIAALTGAAESEIERLAGGDLSEVLLVRRPDGRCTVAKGGPAVSTEAAMLRSLAGLEIPVPQVEGEFGDVLLLEHVANDAVFSARAWADIGRQMRRLHEAIDESYGWPVDYALGSVVLDNRQARDWPRFWFEQRLASTAAVLDRPWRDRIAALRGRLLDLLPSAPPASLLHGDLWSGNILVSDGNVAAFIDPACYHGDAEVDLAMLTLFDAPPESFWQAYGELREGREERQAAYQLFPALVHLRLFGGSYGGLVERLLARLGA
jgi:fructosamine-3-kinase